MEACNKCSGALFADLRKHWRNVHQPVVELHLRHVEFANGKKTQQIERKEGVRS